MTVGQRADTVTVTAETPTVDVQNARQVSTFAGEDIRDLPTTRNIRSILTLTPGLTADRSGRGLRGRRRRLVQQQHLQPGRARRHATDSALRRRHACRRVAQPGPRHGRRDDHQHRGRRRDHGDDRRLCRRRRERPGSQRADFRGAGRIGNRRCVDQHHSAHRRQQIRRQLLHDLHAGAV